MHVGIVLNRDLLTREGRGHLSAAMPQAIRHLSRNAETMMGIDDFMLLEMAPHMKMMRSDIKEDQTVQIAVGFKCPELLIPSARLRAGVVGVDAFVLCRVLCS